MERIFALEQQEVVDQTSITKNSLRPHTALAGDQVVGLNLWHQALQATGKRGLTQGTVHLLSALAVIASKPASRNQDR